MPFERIVPQELPTAPPGRHYHLCDQGCLTHIVCAAGPECNDPWTCPNCELDRRDAWMEAEAQRRRSNDTQ